MRNWWASAIVFIASATILAGTRDARAGDYVYSGILAATPNGGTYAFCDTSDGAIYRPDACGLKTTGSDAVLVTAACTKDGDSQMTPFASWRWPTSHPAISHLRPFEPKAAAVLARSSRDLDTDLCFAELFDGATWIPARLFEACDTEVTGAFKSADRYVVRLTTTGQLSEVDQLWTPSLNLSADRDARAERSRRDAQAATDRLRGHRSAGTGIFANSPATAKADAWRRRRGHGVASVLHKWEEASIWRRLSKAEMREALWLLSWLDSDPRRKEAMRWFASLHSHDPTGAAQLQSELTHDPDTAALANILSSAGSPATK